MILPADLPKPEKDPDTRRILVSASLRSHLRPAGPGLFRAARPTPGGSGRLPGGPSYCRRAQASSGRPFLLPAGPGLFRAALPTANFCSGRRALLLCRPRGPRLAVASRSKVPWSQREWGRPGSLPMRAVCWKNETLELRGTPKPVPGPGAIGLSVVLCLKHRGAGPIAAADFSAERRELARLPLLWWEGSLPGGQDSPETRGAVRAMAAATSPSGQG